MHIFFSQPDTVRQDHIMTNRLRNAGTIIGPYENPTRIGHKENS
jgi:hypothetical protein